MLYRKCLQLCTDCDTLLRGGKITNILAKTILAFLSVPEDSCCCQTNTLNANKRKYCF